MHVIYALRMNHSFGSSFVRHLRMELVRSDGVPARNEVMSSEKYLKATADSMNVFFARVLAAYDIIDSASVSISVLGLVLLNSNVFFRDDLLALSLA